MKISVVMAAANQGNYLAETVESVRDGLAGADDYEIIVIDDASSDGCANLIKSHEKLTLLRNETQQGCSRSRRRGMELATGDVMMITDPHCIFPTGSIVKLAQDADNKHGISQPVVFMEGTGKVRGGAMMLSYRGLQVGRSRRLYRHPTLLGSIYLFPRRVYEFLGGFPTLPGIWGRWEQYMTCITYLYGLDVIVNMDVLCTHRQYRKHGVYPYPYKHSEAIRNTHWVHAICLPSTYESIWKKFCDHKYGKNPEFTQDIGTPAYHKLKEKVWRKAVMDERELLLIMCRISDAAEHFIVRKKLREIEKKK